MPKFAVTVKRDAASSVPSPFDLSRHVISQNAAHAAAVGLSLAGGGFAEVIEVTALAPVPGRSALTTFHQCSQGAYGFCYASRSSSGI